MFSVPYTLSRQEIKPVYSTHFYGTCQSSPLSALLQRVVLASHYKGADSVCRGVKVRHQEAAAEESTDKAVYSPRFTRAPYPLSRSVLWKLASCILDRECRGDGDSTILGERGSLPRPNLSHTHTTLIRRGNKEVCPDQGSQDQTHSRGDKQDTSSPDIDLSCGLLFLLHFFRCSVKWAFCYCYWLCFCPWAAFLAVKKRRTRYLRPLPCLSHQEAAVSREHTRDLSVAIRAPRPQSLFLLPLPCAAICRVGVLR